jgi:hypothetical protein
MTSDRVEFLINIAHQSTGNIPCMQESMCVVQASMHVYTSTELAAGTAAAAAAAAAAAK